MAGRERQWDPVRASQQRRAAKEEWRILELQITVPHRATHRGRRARQSLRIADAAAQETPNGISAEVGGDTTDVRAVDTYRDLT